MFIRQSTYNKLIERCAAAEYKYDALLKEWNDLVDKINDKGGHSFLQGTSTQFDAKEIKQLITLCHPDKHQNNIIAKDITAKLLTMR